MPVDASARRGGVHRRVADLPGALLWDFDGTLVESEDSWFRAYERLCRSWGHELTQAESMTLVGRSLRDCAQALMDFSGRTGLDPDHYAQVATDYALEDMGAHGVPWRPGALALLEQAADAGVACALVSGTFERVLNRFVDLLWPGAFAVVVGGDSVRHGKPDPEPYLTAVARLGRGVRDCVALEDSVPGTTSAERAGLATIGVPFKQQIGPGPRRVVVESLDALTLDGVGAIWRELRDA